MKKNHHELIPSIFSGKLKPKLLVLLCCLLSFSGLYAQNKTYDVSFQDQPIQSAITSLEKLSGYKFVYMDGAISENTTITVDLKGATLEEILNNIFTDSNMLAYRIEGKTIIINRLKLSRAEITKAKTSGKPIGFGGVVVDKNNQPIPGVTVIQKGTTVAGSTGANGSFFLMVKPKEVPQTFVFSQMGLQTREVAIIGENNIITMEDDAEMLEAAEVVSMGYTKVTRRDMVGAVQQVKADDIFMPNVTSVDEMLQGQFAGMMVQNTSHMAGSSPKIQIRGQNTLLGQTAPIWVVDGIILPDPPSITGSSGLVNSDAIADIMGSQISWLNPNDIESITILKDASATAIYGARAANGVIVITTKRAAINTISVNYTTNLSYQPRPTYSSYNLMNSQERIIFSREAFEEGASYRTEPSLDMNTYEGLLKLNLDGKISKAEFDKQYEFLETVNTDWLKLLTRDAFRQNHNLSISGGTIKSNYLLSLSYFDDQGIEKGNDSNRYTARLTSGFELTNAIRLNVSLGASLSKTSMFMNGINPLDYALSTSRSIPAYDQEGELAYFKQKGTYKYNNKFNAFNYNILNEIENSRSDVTTPQFDGNFTFNWKLTPLFTFEAVGGVANTNRRLETYAGERTNYITVKYRGYEYGVHEEKDFYAALLPFGGEFLTENAQNTSYNGQAKLIFAKTINKLHRFNALAACEVRSVHTNSGRNTVWGYMEERGRTIAMPTDFKDFKPNGVSLALDPQGIYGALYTKNGWNAIDRKDNFLSFFATSSYVYNDKYILNVNFRNDASNKFGSAVKTHFDPTYSFGAAWNITEEPFMKPLKSIVSYMKIGATYGIQGNVLNTTSTDLTVKGLGEIDNNYAAKYTTIVQLANPFLAWEKTKQWNASFDVSLFSSFVTASIQYYNTNTNAISMQFISPEHGQKYTAPQNGNIITNEGLELVLNLTPIRKNDISLNIAINWSKNWNTIKEIKPSAASANYLSTYIGGQKGTLLVEPSYPIGSFWAYSFAGLDPETGYPMFNNIDEKSVNYFTDFLVYAGKDTPDITAGINLHFRYKSFSISSIFSALLGKTARLTSPYKDFEQNGRMPYSEKNLDKELLNRWKKAGDEQYTTIPALYTGGKNYLYNLPFVNEINGQATSSGISMYEMWRNSDVRLVDASFLRCQNISLNWYVKGSWLKVVKVKNLSLSATMSNVFVIANSKWGGFDPETKKSKLPHIYTLGLNIGF